MSEKFPVQAQPSEKILAEFMLRVQNVTTHAKDEKGANLFPTQTWTIIPGTADALIGLARVNEVKNDERPFIVNMHGVPYFAKVLNNELYILDQEGMEKRYESVFHKLDLELIASMNQQAPAETPVAEAVEVPVAEKPKKPRAPRKKKETV